MAVLGQAPLVLTPRSPECHPDRKHYGRGLCSACYQRQWRATHPGRQAEYNVRYMTGHREEVLAKRATSRADHVEELRAKSLAYDAGHRAERTEAMRARRMADPEGARALWAAQRAAHPDRRQVSWAAWYANNREGVRERRKAYDREHPEVDRSYREAHRDEIAARNRAWKQAHPEMVRNQFHRRRARKMGNGAFRVTERDWRRLVERYGRACAYCGRADLPLLREHVVPIFRGGRHSIGNLLPACEPCNLSKGYKLLIEWRRRAGVFAQRHP